MLKKITRDKQLDQIKKSLTEEGICMLNAEHMSITK
jgi:hypothetical protein